MAEGNIGSDKLVEVEAEYFSYWVEEMDGAELFGKAYTRLVNWSMKREMQAQRAAVAELGAGSEVIKRASLPFQMARDYDFTLSNRYFDTGGDLGRHEQRVDVMVRQLMALAAIPSTVFNEDYLRQAVERNEYDPFATAGALSARDTWFRCLPPFAWPGDPGVPPFAIVSSLVFFSPVQGLGHSCGCAPQHSCHIKFQVPRWFLDEGGWQAMKSAASSA